ncbi:MAG: hypothetical protein ACTSXF_12130 [Promethearchaeota archaeon]
MQFGEDFELTPEDITKLEPEINYVTQNSEIETIALVTETGYQIAFASLDPNMSSDVICGIASALTLTGRMCIQTMFVEQLSEIIVRAGSGYIVVASAGRFVLVGASRTIKSMGKTIKVFRVAAERIGAMFPSQ